MNSRERLIQTLNHKEPDRIPVDLGGTDVSHICRGAYVDLLRFLGTPAPEHLALENMVEQLPVLDGAFLDRVIHADTRQVREGGPSNWQLDICDDGEYTAYIGEWGFKFRMPKLYGHYYDLDTHPLAEATRSSLSTFPWPDPADPARWAGLRKHTETLYRTTDYALVVGCIFGGGVYEYPQYLRGMENFFMDLVSDEPFAEDLLERITEILITAYSCMLEQVGPFVQVVSMCDDLSTQRGPMIAPELYRRLIKPRHARLVHEIKKRTDAKVLFHICGAAHEFIPDLIDVGVDILNPVQVSAANMDTRELKREFGKEMTFWGGTCDTQHVLPFGTVEQVRDEVKRRIDDLARDGGFVFAPIHNIQDGVPPQNILAMFETVQELGNY